MRLGISSYTYVWAVGVPGYPRPAEPMTARALLDKASEMGLHVLQVADNLPLHRLSAVELASFARYARELCIDLEVGTRGATTSTLSTYLEIAQQLQSPILRVVADTQTHQTSPTKLAETLKTSAPAFEQAGVTIAIENHDRYPAESLRKIVSDVDSPHVGICFDTANSIGCLEQPEHLLDLLGPYVVNVHFKDFEILRLPHSKGFIVEGRPAGQGRLDLPRLLTRIRERGREMSAILELWPPPESTIEETIEKEDRWASESVSFLRKLITE